MDRLQSCIELGMHGLREFVLGHQPKKHEIGSRVLAPLNVQVIRAQHILDSFR